MCEYCDTIQTELFSEYTNLNDNFAWIGIFDKKHFLFIKNELYVTKHQINYCPFCGKELILNTEPTTPHECTTIFQYLRLLDTFTERKGPEYEKWRYASDFAFKNPNVDYKTIINHVEKKFKKNERNEF